MASGSANWEAVRRNARWTRGRTPAWTLAWELGERSVSAAALVAAAPAMVALGGAVAAVSRQTPFVAHERVGLGGERFWMWKLRTMWGAEPVARRGGLVEYLDDPPVPLEKKGGDPRVTHALGRWLRRTSLDELPQLVHVVSGRMSLVGPRPMTHKELQEYYGRAVEEVISVKPGITGLWQVAGRSRLTYAQRLRCDLFFVRKRCFGLSARILARTFRTVWRGESAC